MRSGVTETLSHPSYTSGRSDFAAFLNASGTYYFTAKKASVATESDPKPLDKEYSARLLALWNYKLADSLKLSVLGSGYALDQIFDLSETEQRPVVSEQKASGASIGATLRWNFTPTWWVSLDATGKRENSPDGYYNRTVRDAEARLGWKPWARLDLSVGGRDIRRDYDVRLQPTLGGGEVPGAILQTEDREGEFRVEVTLDAAAHWKWTTRLTTQRFTDNGTGLWNFTARKIAPEIEWESGTWRASIDGYARRVEYPLQTVGIGVAPPKRVRDDYRASVHFEHDLTRRWTAFVEYNWERNRSNDPATSYSMNEGLLGIRWNWDK